MSSQTTAAPPTPMYPQIRDLPILVSSELCEGKTYIVTGANVGLGLEAARHLVKSGAAKVILAVRNLEAGKAAKEDIEQTTGIQGVAEVWQLDLASYTSVRAFAEKANALPRIDGVVENAGMAGLADVFAEGYPLQVTVNVLSTFYLAILLLPKLRQDAHKFGYQPRLSVVASGQAVKAQSTLTMLGTDPLEAMKSNKELAPMLYPATKLAQVLVVKRLGKLLPLDQGVVLNVIDPGLCVTTLSRNAPQAFKDQLKKYWEESGRTAEEGSRTLLAGVVAPESSHGCYMADCRVAEDQIPEWVTDAACQTTWNSIKRELEKVDAEAMVRCFAGTA